MAQLLAEPTADTHLASAGPTVNYGSETFLRAGTDKFGISGITYYRPLLRFDVGTLLAGATVSAATLTLFPAGGVLPNGGTFNLYRVTQTAWTESGATWRAFDGTNEWVTYGGDYSATDGDSATVATASENLVFSSLKDLVEDAIANRAGLLHLILIGPESGSVDNYYEARSSDASQSSERPLLTVTYIEPLEYPLHFQLAKEVPLHFQLTRESPLSFQLTPEFPLSFVV